MSPVTEFESRRRRMFGIAYRMLGSAHDAEDIVQDAYLRWDRADRDAIVDPTSWLDRVVINLCLNRAAQASVRRESYPGTWLPEPVLTGETTPDPLEHAERGDDVSLALLLLLERLSPAERAVFVLRTSFGYSHREMAELLDVSAAASRQLLRRARAHLDEDHTRYQADPAEHRHLLDRFLRAARDADLGRLEQLLTDDVVSRADGGGIVNVARGPITGREKVARYLGVGVMRFGARGAMSPAEVNGLPGFVCRIDGRIAAVLAISIRDGRIAAVQIVAHPAKVAYLARQEAAMSHPRRASGSSLL